MASSHLGDIRFGLLFTVVNALAPKPCTIPKSFDEGFEEKFLIHGILVKRERGIQLTFYNLLHNVKHFLLA